MTGRLKMTERLLKCDSYLLMLLTVQIQFVYLQTCQKLGRELFEEQREMLKCETVGFLRKHQKVRK